MLKFKELSSFLFDFDLGAEVLEPWYLTIQDAEQTKYLSPNFRINFRIRGYYF